jgi:alanyl-tRNA synthetase
MQQHSGQHLLSAVLAELLGHTTVSVHIGQHSSTIDLDASQLTPEQVVQVEERANEVITENRRVEVTFEEAATAIGLRKTPTRSGTLRIVTIADLDRSACGGTHVRATGEIGSILLRKVERARKGVRVEFLCGLRAIRLSRRESEVLGRLSSELSSSIEELPQVLESKQVELKEVTAIKRTLETSLNGYRAKELYSAAVPDATGIRRTLVRQSSGPMDELRGLAQAFASLPQAVFIGAIEAPPSVLLGAAADSGIDAGGVLKGILQAAGGRGGGSAGLAQGVLPGLPQLEQVIASLGGTKK